MTNTTPMRGAGQERMREVLDSIADLSELWDDPLLGLFLALGAVLVMAVLLWWLT